MIEKRILLVEDIGQLEFMEDLFRRNLNSGLYELRTIPDLSDERVYIRHLLRDYDVYWLHSSAVEFEAMDEIKEKQPWSKIVVRTSMAESKYAYNYLKRKRVDFVISNNEGLDEERIIQILNKFGIEIVLPEQDNKK